MTTKQLNNIASVDGFNLILTIDEYIQQTVETKKGNK